MKAQVKMKKLRLLLFEKCNRKCVGCCNEDWNLKNLEQERQFSDYDEIFLTGGEPMLNPRMVIDIAILIRKVSKAKIYLYTAKVDKRFEILAVLNFIDGITLTLHEQNDVEDFEWLNFWLEDAKLDKSFRLNIFKGVVLPYITYTTNIWKVKKDIEWIKNCPLPKDEIFKRL